MLLVPWSTAPTNVRSAIFRKHNLVPVVIFRGDQEQKCLNPIFSERRRYANQSFSYGVWNVTHLANTELSLASRETCLVHIRGKYKPKKMQNIRRVQRCIWLNFINNDKKYSFIAKRCISLLLEVWFDSQRSTITKLSPLSLNMRKTPLGNPQAYSNWSGIS